MKNIIFTGQPNSGKTRILFELSHWLVKDKGYAIIDGQLFPDEFVINGNENDVRVLLGKEGRKVLVVSATDDENCIDILKNMIEKSDILYLADYMKQAHSVKHENMKYGKDI